MKSCPTPETDARARGRRGFTLAEVLAALLMMGIIIPVALQGFNVLSRVTELGGRKVQAMQVADRILNEQLSLVGPGDAVPTSGSGVEQNGDQSYPWTMQTEPWSEDNMTQVTVTVTFTMRGSSYQMTASTIYDPNAGTPGTPSNTVMAP